MQAIRNKLTGKSKRSSKKSPTMDQSSQNLAPQTLTPAPSAPGAVVTEFNESHKDLPSGAHVDHFEKMEVINSAPLMNSGIPVPPPAPPADFFKSHDSKFDVYNTAPVMSEFPTEFPTESVHTMEILPVEVIEKPVIIHESIRQEQIEEIQPVVRVEREKTEIRQIVQPLTDKEIRPVLIEERTLPVEILPTIVDKVVAAPERFEISTRDFDNTIRQVVEKAPIVQETEKWRIIEEVQPIIYREVVVPHVIRTSRPMREVIVEAPIFTEQVLSARSLSANERSRWSSFFSKETVAREVMTSIPVTSIVEPQILRVVAAAPATSESIHKKEIIEETTTTTTTTTVAAVAAAVPAASTRSSGASTSTLSAAPVVINESHDTKVGPHGEMITRDSFTTTSSSVLPTRAN